MATGEPKIYTFIVFNNSNPGEPSCTGAGGLRYTSVQIQEMNQRHDLNTFFRQGSQCPDVCSRIGS